MVSPTRTALVASTLSLFLLTSTRLPAKAHAIERVSAKHVCMVNNQVSESDMIAVEIDGKRYFTCCDLCKKTLIDHADMRTATDPITGRQVDKATAVLGALPDRTVLYFESARTLADYRERNE